MWKLGVVATRPRFAVGALVNGNTEFATPGVGTRTRRDVRRAVEAGRRGKVWWRRQTVDERTMEFEQSLLEELRDLARKGERPCALVELIGARLGVHGSSYRLQAIAYFQEAFGLPLVEAMRIGAAPVFEESGRSAADVDAAVGAILAEYRPFWDAKPR
jgi:hypothetical protein